MTELPEPPDLPCQQLVELATDHLEGALDPATTHRVVNHLETCPDCVEFVDQIGRTAGLLAHLPRSTLSPSTRERVLGEFRDQRGRR